MNLKRHKIKGYLLVTFISLLFLGSFKKDYFEVSKQLDIFATLFKELNIYYVDDTDPDKLMNTAIESMLKTLDPYTTFFSESEAEDFSIHTTGEYAGIGASVRKLDDKIVIFQVYEGFAADKAGLKAGDEIVEIDGNIMKGKNTDDVSAILKGSIGSTTSVKINRPETSVPFNLIVKREKIKVKSVPFYGMINDETGYIVLTSFSRKATREVSQAFDKLKSRGMKSLVLDFRDNPGGLLSQAVGISNLFLPKKTMIVETKGKIKDWNKKYYTKTRAKDEKMPVVVLTNYGTASASEIVAGSLQDLDRAVIMGSRTFGKGLVQQPRKLAYGTQLKITIAKYYIPSGRSIQARDYFDRNNDGSVRVIPDSMRTSFKTNKGRIVFDGGGITPDIKLSKDTLTSFTEFLLDNSLLFKFSVKYCNSTEKNVDLNTFELSDSDLRDFKKYVDSSGEIYKSELDSKLIELKKLAKKENVLSELKPSINELESKMIEEHKNIYERNKAQIKRILTLSIINNEHYQKGRYLYNLKHDKVISEATKLLSNKPKYNSILNNN